MEYLVIIISLPTSQQWLCPGHQWNKANTRRCSGEAERTVELKSGWVSFLRIVSIELEKVSLEIEKVSIEFEKASSKFEKVSIEFVKK